MKVHRTIPVLEKSIITIGSFDGLHLGHRYLIEEVKRLASDRNLPFYLISFDPHPRQIVNSDAGFKLLQTWDEKLETLEKMGVENVVAIPFTKELSLKSAEEFILQDILTPLQPKVVVLGYDHKFGKDRQGSIDTLKNLKNKLQLDIDILELSEYMKQRQHISSTIIRRHILHGEITKANELLGYVFNLSGKVVYGKQLGRTIGYPTANLELESPHKILPAYGVYNTTIAVDGKTYKAATNIGLNPTVEESSIPKIETYILDFNEMIYDKKVRLYFHDFIRGEVKYDSIEELQRAIKADVERVKTI